MALLASLHLLCTAASAQGEFTLYQLKDNVFQAQSMNPAFIPVTDFNLGLMSVSATAQSPFRYSDLVRKEDNGNLVIDSETLDLTIGTQRNVNSLYGDVRVDLFQLAFRHKNTMISVMPAIRAENRLRYSRDFLDWAWNGNADIVDGALETRDIELERTGVRSMSFFELPIGLATKVDERLTLGMRVKYLRGLAFAQSSRVTGRLGFDEGSGALSLTANPLELKTSNLAWALDNNFQNPFDDFSLGIDEVGSDSSKVTNWGLGVDVGIHYKLSKRWELSAALNDLGYIRWKENSVTYTIDRSEATLPIANINDVLGLDHSGQSVGIEEFGDSLRSSFQPQKDESSFTSGLTTRLFGSAAFRVDNYQRLNATWLVYFNGAYVNSALSAGYTAQIGKMFNAAANVTYTNQDVHIGTGLSLNTYLFQLHLMSDNILAVFIPQNQRYAQLRIGMNVALRSSVEQRELQTKRRERRSLRKSGLDDRTPIRNRRQSRRSGQSRTSD